MKVKWDYVSLNAKFGLIVFEGKEGIKGFCDALLVSFGFNSDTRFVLFRGIIIVYDFRLSSYTCNNAVHVLVL